MLKEKLNFGKNQAFFNRSSTKLGMNFFEELLKVFKEVGLPSKILVRDRETLSYINEIVEIIGCEVEISPKLFGIDHIYETFNQNNGF